MSAESKVTGTLVGGVLGRIAADVLPKDFLLPVSCPEHGADCAVT